jgi:hypothetical protein
MSAYLNLTHVGWEQTAENNQFISTLFAESTVRFISRRISEMLHGLDPEGRTMYVDDEKIRQVLSSVYSNGTRLGVGDMYTRDHIIPHEERDDIQNFIQQTISICVRSVRNQFDMNAINAKLDKWTTVLGESNAHGLRAHAPIKRRERHPQYMAFSMRY